MNYTLLHIFRNTPFGRETFLQSLYFCKTINAFPVVYIPQTDKFLMYFSDHAVQIDLDSSYLISPENAKEHVIQLSDEMGLQLKFYEPTEFTASSLPDIPISFDYMCCPRSVSDQSSKIGLGNIGPRVRGIIRHATFPVLIPSSVFKPWKSISVLYGGSANAVNAVRLGLKLASFSGLSLNIFTLIEKNNQTYYEHLFKEQGLGNSDDMQIKEWFFYEKEEFDNMLYEIPHDSLIISGAYGHGIIKDLLFGSKMEKIQTTLPNNLLVVGPNCSVSL